MPIGRELRNGANVPYEGEDGQTKKVSLQRDFESSVLTSSWLVNCSILGMFLWLSLSFSSFSRDERWNVVVVFKTMIELLT